MQSALTRLAELADAYPYLAILQNHGLAHAHVAVARTRGQRGRCYGNALARAMDEPGHIHYVEGLAVHPRTGLVLPHAWVEDDNGTPLEVTWPSTTGWVFLGMRFSLDDLLRLSEHRDETVLPILDADWETGYRYVRSHRTCCPIDPRLR